MSATSPRRIHGRNSEEVQNLGGKRSVLLPLRDAWRVYSGLITCNEDVTMLLCEMLQTEHDSSITKNKRRRVEVWRAPASAKQTKTPFYYFATLFTYLWFTESHCQ
jgi:hypothetical protein